MVSTFWLAVTAFALSLAWLLPNHSPPWLSFHGDAWSACILSLLGAWIAIKANLKPRWNVLTLLLTALVAVPWIQYFIGLIPVFGVAWINSIYLLGFLFAIQTGEQWERQSPNQCANFIFLAVFIAAVISVVMQFYQWAGLNSAEPWIMNVASGNRFYANIAQPNNLGSLLMLGLIACSWWYKVCKLSPYAAISVAIFITIGIALTGSRTAWLNMLLLILILISYRSVVAEKKYIQTVVFIGLCLALIVLVLPYINTLIAADSGADGVRTLTDPVRIKAWQMMSFATLQKPLLGYGWGQLNGANYQVVGDFPPTYSLFGSSHNMLLDLVLWNGYPIGVLIIGVLIWWLFNIIKNIKNIVHLHIFAFLMVLGIHSMLEFPLHYAFFLLPLGLMVGNMNANIEIKTIAIGQRWAAMSIACFAIGALLITIEDYFKIENSFYGLRFEAKKIQTDIPKTPPDIIALTQFREHIAIARFEPKPGMSKVELQRMAEVVTALPSYIVMYKLAVSLALNNQPAEASTWLTNICKTTPKINCDDLRVRWQQDAIRFPVIAKVLPP